MKGRVIVKIFQKFFKSDRKVDYMIKTFKKFFEAARRAVKMNENLLGLFKNSSNIFIDLKRKRQGSGLNGRNFLCSFQRDFLGLSRASRRAYKKVRDFQEFSESARRADKRAEDFTGFVKTGRRADKWVKDSDH